MDHRRPITTRVAGAWGLVAALALGVALTYLFWWPLWNGGGLVGGDLYSYFMPQKLLLADQLKAGEIPLWNPHAGLGYPVLGESQTGAIYPPNLFLYKQFDVNAAYSISQLLHYVLAFLGAWLLGRQHRLSRTGALWLATVFIYSWFPARICLEWTIIGGTYFVWILYAVERFRSRPSAGPCIAVALLLALALLAGHYTLAFITLLTITLRELVAFLGALRSPTRKASSTAPDWSWRGQCLLGAAIVCGFLLAMPQVLQTWELRQRSQRSSESESFDPCYGHIPPMYLTHLVAPWLWHGPEIDADGALSQLQLGAVDATTNKAEAFIYAGLIPLVLAIGGGILWRRNGWPIPDAPTWLMLTGLSLLASTGWPTRLLQDVPGFGFFSGPGRYSIVAIFVIALLSAFAFDQLLARFRSLAAKTLFVVVLFGFTIGDLWLASREYPPSGGPYFGRQVFYATLVDESPLQYREASPFRKVLLREERPPRLFAPGPNVPTLLGVSSIPVYLGLGPAVYFDGRFDLDLDLTDVETIEEATDRLAQFGVTHLLVQAPLNTERWPIEPVLIAPDPLINSVWARREPLYLYRLKRARGRVFLPGSSTSTEIQAVQHTPHEVRIKVDTPGDTSVVLADLDYPGWEATLDGKPISNSTHLDVLRSVEVPAGSHEIVWSYRPASLRWGIVCSMIGVIILAILAWLSPRCRQPAT